VWFFVSFLFCFRWLLCGCCFVFVSFLLVVVVVGGRGGFGLEAGLFGGGNGGEKGFELLFLGFLCVCWVFWVCVGCFGCVGCCGDLAGVVLGGVLVLGG
jgi:hypothetical protein